MVNVNLPSPEHTLFVCIIFSISEAFLFCLLYGQIHQRFQPAKNKSIKPILLKHAYTTRLNDN